MKMNSVRQVLILGAAFLLPSSSLQAKTGACSTAATAGNWAYTYHRRRKMMNRKSTLITLTILLLTASLSFAAGPSCSMAKVSGSYGYTTSGFVLAPSGSFVPAAAAGRIHFNAERNVSGTQTRVVDGSALAETYTWTYTVNPDCTGDFTVLVQPDTRTSSVHLVWTDNAKGISAVFTTPGFVLTATANRISPAD